jgi:ABC-2 type transport system permease protein
MAVYKRSYKGYSGALTPEWSRFLVIPRQAWRGLFKQRFLIIFYVICFFYPLGCAITIYLNDNLSFLSQYIPNINKDQPLLDIGGKFFFIFTSVQGTFAFILTAFIGPGLVSPDLVNNALPLYFCRPFSRTEYVLGKLAAIALPLSYITWVPGLLLFGLQANLAGRQWLSQNLWIAGSIILGSLIWILLISLLSLALSAWVRWKIVAGALMLVVFFLGSGLSETIRAVFRAPYGYWLDMGSNIGRVWLDLFRIQEPKDVSVTEATGALLGICVLCLFLLARKVRAYEVVK